MNRLQDTVKHHKYNLALLIAIWSIYIVHVVPGGGVNPNRYFDLLHSIVHQHTLTIDAYHENTIDKAFKDGHFYSAGLPGPSVFGVPSYLVFHSLYKIVPNSWVAPLSSIQSYKQNVSGGFYQQDNVEFFLSTIWITWFTLSLFSAFGAIVLYCLMMKLGISSCISFISTVIYSFGTPVFFFSTTYFSHVFNASLIILVLYLLVVKSTDTIFTAFLTGLITGITVLIEYHGLVFISIVGLYIWCRYGFGKALYYSLGVAFALLLFFSYNYSTLGSPFALPHQWLADNNREKVHGVGLLGFTLPNVDHLLGLVILPDHGLLIYSPILILAPVGWLHMLRSTDARIRDVSVLSVLATTIILIWFSSYTDWSGGATFGPRQIVSTLPFFILGTAFGIRGVPRLVWIPLFIISIITNWLGAQFGFASNIFEHWRTFANQGFALPWMLAIISHSRNSNALLLFVTHYSWIIDLCYLLLVTILGITCSRIARIKQQLGDTHLSLVSASGQAVRLVHINYPTQLIGREDSE